MRNTQSFSFCFSLPPQPFYFPEHQLKEIRQSGIAKGHKNDLFFPLCSQYWEVWVGGTLPTGFRECDPHPTLCRFWLGWRELCQAHAGILESRTFQCPKLCQWGAAQKFRRSMARTGDLKWPKGHSTPYTAQFINWEPPITAGGQVLSNCLGITALPLALFPPPLLSSLLLLNHDTLQNISGYFQWSI